MQAILHRSSLFSNQRKPQQYRNPQPTVKTLSYFDNILSFVFEHDIFQLQVSMNDSSVVTIWNCIDNLVHNLSTLDFIKSSICLHIF